MIKHLKVPESEAQNAKDFLDSIGALNTDFLPFKKNGSILWPLNFDVEGELVEMEGVPVTNRSRDYRRKLPKEIQDVAPRAFDIFGEIAIIRLPKEIHEFSDSIASALIHSNPNVTKVAMDLGVKGSYRIRELKLIGGESGFVTTHKENGLKFRLDISKVYFSPRLSMERQRLSRLVEPGERILDAFAGAAPFSITLAKNGGKVTAVDANPESERWAEENFNLNHIPISNYEFICSRIEDTVESLNEYDRIIMNNPTKSLDYVHLLTPLVRKGGMVHVYCILSNNQTDEVFSVFGPDFELTLMREVHPYSPATSMMVFDMKKS